MRITNRELWNAALLYGDPTKVGAHDPGPKRRQDNPESRILNDVLKMLRFHPRVGWAVRINTGALKDHRGQVVRFGFVGCPDIIGQMKDGRLLAVECKSEVGRLTDDQRVVIERIKQFGGIAGVARSIQDAMNIVEGRS